MRITKIAPAQSFEREFDGIATDKSISHRAAIFALLSSAPCEVEGYLMGEDTLHTLLFQYLPHQAPFFQPQIFLLKVYLKHYFLTYSFLSLPSQLKNRQIFNFKRLFCMHPQ